MIVTRAEILIAFGKAGANALTQDDRLLLDLIHPLVESTVLNYLQIKVESATYTEFLPIGNPEQDRDDNLADYEKINGRVVFVGSAPGMEFLQLRHAPVQNDSVLAVYEDIGAYGGQASGAFDPTTTLLTKGSDYFLDIDQTGVSNTGIIYRIGGVWPREPRTVKVIYTGGRTPAELNGSGGSQAGAIKLATLETLVQSYKQFKTLQKTVGALVSENIGLYSYSTYGPISAALTGLVIDIPHSAKLKLNNFYNWGRLFG